MSADKKVLKRVNEKVKELCEDSRVGKFELIGYVEYNIFLIKVRYEYEFDAYAKEARPRKARFLFSNPPPKLDNKERKKEILKMLENKVPQQVIAEFFNISQVLVSNIHSERYVL